MTIGNSATANPAPPELSLVIPTRDEAANVRSLLERIDGALAGLDCEVVVVDDSDDDTVTLLRQAQRRHPGLHCHHRDPLDRAGGLSTAVVEGLRRARGTYVCVMDADLQHPPERIPTMLAAARRGADLVVASRYVRGGSRAGLANTGRRLVSRATAALARALFTEARATTDPLAGFFLCRRELLEGREFRPIGFKILLELLVCSPPLVVEDVALAFAPRAAGSSKASVRQGLLYLRHLLSLLRDVPGSARRWKFAAVGLSGLAVFTALLAVGRLTLGWPPLAAWALAFAPSFAWTFAANRAVTFADMRRGWDDRGARYPRSALVAGAVQLLAFWALLGTGGPVLADGVGAAVLGMAVNAILNYRLVHRRSRAPHPGTGDERPLRHLVRLSGATAGGILPVGDEGRPRLDGSEALRVGDQPGAVPPELLQRVIRTRRPAVWAEAPSSRPQRRTNIELRSVLLVPVVREGRVGAVVALLRDAPQPFGGTDLDRALGWVAELAELFAPAAGEAPAGTGIPRPAPASRPTPSVTAP